MTIIAILSGFSSSIFLILTVSRKAREREGGNLFRLTLYASRNLKILGDHSEGVTPVPIPNTEVKPFSADGTAWVTVWESRTLPRLNFKSLLETAGFFVENSKL